MVMVCVCVVGRGGVCVEGGGGRLCLSLSSLDVNYSFLQIFMSSLSVWISMIS